MNPERWESVKRLFMEATLSGLDHDEAQRHRTQDSIDRAVNDLVLELLAQSPDGGPDLRHACWLPSSSPSLEYTLNPGRKLLGRFEIFSFLGSGGIGEVYKAFDHQQGEFVALKTLRPFLVKDKSAVEILRNELNTARSVTHINVCRVYDFHWSDTSDFPPFVTMELMEGETLSVCLRRWGTMSTSAAQPLVEQILHGLEAAHQRNIVHRDLKPSNVMVVSDGTRAVVMDFGLARDTEPGQDLPTTLSSHSFAGTPAYMAPEQFCGERATIVSDIYAVGVIMFEMVTGRPPFSGATPIEIASRRLYEHAPKPSKYVAGLHPSWDRTISQCLEREPRNRPQSARLLLESLHQPATKVVTRRLLVSLSGTLIALGGAGVLVIPRKAQVSVAVYDIENQTGDSTLDYLCKGTTNEIVRRLPQVSGTTLVQLYAPASSGLDVGAARFAFKGVLKTSGTKPYLTVELFDGKLGRTVWTQPFRLDDPRQLLKTQAQIAQAVATQLADLGGQQIESGDSRGRSPTTNTSAFDFYLRGSSLLQEGTPESVRAAMVYFQQAVAEDERFALAYAALAEALLALRSFGYTSDVETIRSARMNAERALREDGQLPEGHAVLGAVRQWEWDWSGSEASYGDALRLKPRFARARRWRAGLILQFERSEEAISEMEMAFKEDPFDRSAVSGYGLTLLFSGRNLEAAEFLEREIGERDMPTARYNLCQAYARLGYLSSGRTADQFFQKAFAQANTVASLERNTRASESELSTRMFSLAYSLRGQLTEAQPFLSQLEEAVAAERSSPGFLAMVYAIQKRLDEAMAIIEESVRIRDRIVLYLRANPFLENLRSLSRFESVLRSVHLK